MFDCEITYTKRGQEEESVIDGTFDEILVGISHLIATFVYEALEPDRNDDKTRSALFDATIDAITNISYLTLDEFISEEDDLCEDEECEDDNSEQAIRLIIDL